MTEKNENISILIVEDNLGDYVLVEDFLIEKFNRVKIKHCKDYVATIEYLKNHQKSLSIILLDLYLPDFGGLELVKEIISYCPNVPVIVLTGYADLNVAQKSLEMGAYDFLIKDEINAHLLQKSIIYASFRKSYINQLEEERLNYENLFNLSPQPMWFLDLETFYIKDINISAIEKYGYSLSESMGMSFLELHPTVERNQLAQMINSSQIDLGNNQFTHIAKSGKEIKVELSIGKLQSNFGQNGIIVQSTDITDILSYISTIEIQNKKLKSIAWTQSHEVRAPISRTLGILNLIENQDEDHEEVQFWLKHLRNSVNEIDEIVRKIVEETQNINPLKENHG